MNVWVLCNTVGGPYPVVFETRKDAYNHLKEFLTFMKSDSQLEELERQYHSDNCEDDIELEQCFIYKSSYYKEGGVLMGKLYAITEGEYSDYRIIGLCSDKARAEEICEQFNAKSCYEAKIEEFDDGATIDVTIPVYEVRLFIKTGEIQEISELSFDNAVEYHLGTYIFSDGPIFCDRSIYRCLVATPLRDTAIKIARDRLAQYKYSLAEQNKKIFENF